jgi:hypothetical protein
MISLALAQPGTAVLSFDLCCATPVLPVAVGRHCSLPRRLLPRQAINAPRQQAASVQIPIAPDALPSHIFRGFLLWRFAYAGPRCAPRHLHGAGTRKPSQKRPVANRIITMSAFHSIVLKKSFWGDDQNFSGLLMRFARGDMRDHIVSHKNDHGASYERYEVLQWRSRLEISFCEIFGAVQSEKCH